MRDILWVAFGGAFGSVLRYLISIYTPLLFGRSHLLTGTMIVNVTGCFLIGVMIQWMDSKQIVDTGVKLFILAGFLGGFTTYSTFGLETIEIFTDSVSNALFYVSLHLILGIGGVWFGLLAAQWVLSL